MTSPSRKKHPTTASDLRRKTNLDTQLGCLALPSRLSWFGSVKLALPTIAGSLTLVATLLAVEFVAAQQQSPEKFARPKQHAPPVHAAPTNSSQRSIQYARPIPTQRAQNPQRNRNVRSVQPQQSQAQRPQVQQRQAKRYPVRQVAAQQELAQRRSDSDRTAQATNSDQQWRTRDQTARTGTNTGMTIEQSAAKADQELRSVMQRPQQSSMPQLNHPKPQPQSSSQLAPPSNSFRSDQSPSFDESPSPDATLGNQIPTPNRFELQRPSGNQPQQQTSKDPFQGSIGGNSTSNSIRQQQPSTVEEFDAGPELTYDRQQMQNPAAQSQTNTPRMLESYSQNNSEGNSLRNLQVEPRRMRDTRSSVNPRRSQSNMIPSGYRRGYQEEENQDDLDDEEAEQEGKGQKSCDEYRAELLNSPITDIVLDISPYQSSQANRDVPYGLTRTWTDCNGNGLGTGTLVRLERSYIVITTETGAEQRIARTRLSDGDLAVMTEFWGLPTECTLGCYAYEGRHWGQKSVLWKASALCHKPLYFENRQLERYGHTHGPIVQPLHSTAHFFTSLVLWPYNSAINPPNECQYALGYYRPGDCAPWLKDPFPISLHGFARQGAFVGGAVGIFP